MTSNGSDPRTESEDVRVPQPDQESSPETGTGQASETDRFAEAARKVTSSAEKIAGAAYRKSKSALESAKFDPMSGIRTLDGLLDWSRSLLPPEKYEAIAAWFAKSGHVALVAAQIMAVIFGLFAAPRLSRGVLFPVGIGIALVLLILQYTADKLMNAGDLLVKASPSRLSSSAFLNCLALVIEVSGIMLFVAMLVKASLLDKWIFTFVGLGLWAFCDAIAYIALNPAMANITVDKDVAAGEEAIGIMSFFVKALVRTVPLLFGVGAIVGAVALFFGFFSLLAGNAGPGYVALTIIAVSACLPFVTYVVFAFYHLLLDILRAILILPHKLDKIAGKEQPTDSPEGSVKNRMNE